MDKFIRNPTEGRLVDSISGEAVGRCVGELIDTLKDARACGMELPEGTVSSWMREMKRLGVSDKAIPLFLAAAQSAAYGDGGGAEGGVAGGGEVPAPRPSPSVLILSWRGFRL